MSQKITLSLQEGQVGSHGTGPSADAAADQVDNLKIADKATNGPEPVKAPSQSSRPPPAASDTQKDDEEDDKEDDAARQQREKELQQLNEELAKEDPRSDHSACDIAAWQSSLHTREDSLVCLENADMLLNEGEGDQVVILQNLLKQSVALRARFSFYAWLIQCSMSHSLGSPSSVLSAQEMYNSIIC